MTRSEGPAEVISMSDYVHSREIPALGEDGHFDLQFLVGYGRGEISGPVGDAIREHCLSCPSCGGELGTILLLLETRDRRAARKRRALGVLAASGVLAAALGAAAFSGALRSPAADVSDLAPPGQDVASADVRSLATAEGPARIDLEFIYPNTVPTGNVPQPDKRAGLSLIVDGRYGDAAARLSDLYSARPTDGETAALLGMALYLSGDDADRVESLLQQGAALRRQDLQHYAQWYLANHYLRRRDVEKAAIVLGNLSRSPDSPGAMAAALLERLGAETR